jgi:hypothetical protein
MVRKPKKNSADELFIIIAIKSYYFAIKYTFNTYGSLLSKFSHIKLLMHVF